jgi:hypothetical protein
MTPTHQLKRNGQHDAVCWRYFKNSPIPVWIARNFHSIGDQGLTHRSGEVLKEGQWVVRDPEQPTCMILDDSEFQKLFVELPKK